MRRLTEVRALVATLATASAVAVAVMGFAPPASASTPGYTLTLSPDNLTQPAGQQSSTYIAITETGTPCTPGRVEIDPADTTYNGSTDSIEQIWFNACNAPVNFGGFATVPGVYRFNVVDMGSGTVVGTFTLTATAPAVDVLSTSDVAAQNFTVAPGVNDQVAFTLAPASDGFCNPSAILVPVSVTITAPAAVTAQATGLYLRGCYTQTLTFSAATPGDYPITVSASYFVPGAIDDSKASFTLHVHNPTPADTTPPVLSLPPAMTVEATGAGGAIVTYAATASDAVDGTVPVTCSPGSGSTLGLGHTTVTCHAADSGDNGTDGSFDVNVVDTTAPVLPNLPDVTATATSAAGATVTFGPATAVDLVDGNRPVTFTPASSGVFGLGATTVSYTATDLHANTAVAKTFKVTVTAPWNGVQQPVNANGTSLFKLGSTVPVKVSCFPGQLVTLTATQSDTTPDGTDVEAVSSNPADTGSAFRNDGTGTCSYNLGTKNMSQGDWYLHLNAGDGVDHATRFSLRK